ncbi:MAG: hypothetical protein DI582_00945 [Azospirillum brasilense]|nr:MAG: hypothetical protein DI582_00945 [Azospirillum brasilense]
MFTRSLLAAGAVMLAGTAAHAQYYPATYQEPYCREFNKVVTVGGQPAPAYGQACYQPDGSWQIMSDQIPRAQPVQYVPAQNQVIYVPQPSPRTVFSFNLNSYNPYRVRYYNEYGHGWRDWNRGHDRRDWDRGRGHGHYKHGHGHGGGHWPR